MGHIINQQGIRPLQDKLEANTKINISKNEEKSKSFLWATQYLSKYIENLSANTDFLRKLLKTKNDWIWTDEHTNVFNKLEEGITKIQCLAHCNAQSKNIITTDASTKGMGATLWQKQITGKLKLTGVASLYFDEYGKEIHNQRTRIASSSLGTGTFQTTYSRKAN